MQIHTRIVTTVAFCILFKLTLTLPAPTSLVSSNSRDDYSSLFATSQIINSSFGLFPSHGLNTSDSNLGLSLPPKNTSTHLTYWTTTWKISSTLSLKINIGAWVLDPEKILHTLEAAESTIGKRPAAGLLERKFTEKTGSWINTMIFEITPGFVYKRLTWADVGEVLGENGLPKFFRQKQEWHTAYFDVIHSTRGELGYGAVRKWYL